MRALAVEVPDPPDEACSCHRRGVRPHEHRGAADSEGFRMSSTAWLPAEWEHPVRVDLSTGHHLRPIKATDVDLDMKAVMGSRERLWSIYG